MNADRDALPAPLQAWGQQHGLLSERWSWRPAEGVLDYLCAADVWEYLPQHGAVWGEAVVLERVAQAEGIGYYAAVGVDPTAGGLTVFWKAHPIPAVLQAEPLDRVLWERSRASVDSQEP